MDGFYLLKHLPHCTVIEMGFEENLARETYQRTGNIASAAGHLLTTQGEEVVVIWINSISLITIPISIWLKKKAGKISMVLRIYR